MKGLSIKDIAKITDKTINKKLIELIESIKNKNNISELNSIKKIIGYSDYYRIRISDYRLGLKYKDNIITFVRFLHRKEIYKNFP
jgi:mRNA interferase RelE/StbE